LTRWLLTPLGPVLNLTCGITRFPYPTFLVWDILGETTWVLIYVLLGKFFSDRVEAISATMGDLTWVILGIAGVVFFGWRLLKSWRTGDKRASKPASVAPPPA